METFLLLCCLCIPILWWLFRKNGKVLIYSGVVWILFILMNMYIEFGVIQLFYLIAGIWAINKGYKLNKQKTTKVVKS